MEKIKTFDRFLSLPREKAYNQFLDEKNLKILKGMLYLFSFIFALIFIITLFDHGSINAGSLLALLTCLVFVFSIIFYKKLFRLTNIRRYVIIFMVTLFVMFVSINILVPDNHNETVKKSEKTGEVEKEKIDTIKFGDSANGADLILREGDSKKNDDVNINIGKDEKESFVQYLVFIGILVLIFKLSRTEIIQIFAIVIGITLISLIISNKGISLNTGLPNLIVGMMLFVIAIATERKRKKNFLDEYNVYYARNYENLRMKKELDYAREIQLSMLPNNDAVIGDLEISAVSLPASEVGGDYFDYFKVSEHEIGFFICDVSGHGVASGLLLSGLRSCMHLILEDNTNPKVVIEKLNRMIRKTQSRKMFVTAVFAVIDTNKNKCKLFNAGHLPPYKISDESKEIYKIKKHGLALGAMNIVEHVDANNEVVFDFKKGDKLILYTDGVNEAMNSSKAEYGLENLEHYLNNNAAKKANELLNGIIEDVKKFTNNSVQRDDLTLLIIQRN